jgi:hypothetical protein
MLACNVGSRGWTPGISVLRTLSANFFRKLSFIRRTTYYLVYHKGRFALNFLGNYSLLSTLIDYPKLLRISTCYFNNHGGHIHISFRYIHLHGSSPSVSNVHSWNRRLQPRNHSGATVGPERARENQNLAVAKKPNVCWFFRCQWYILQVSCIRSVVLKEIQTTDAFMTSSELYL